MPEEKKPYNINMYRVECQKYDCVILESPDGEITPYVVPNEKTQEEFEDEVMGLVEKKLVSSFSKALKNKTQDKSSDRTVATFKAMLNAEAERLGIMQRAI